MQLRKHGIPTWWLPALMMAACALPSQAADGPRLKFQKVAEGVYAGFPNPGSGVAASTAFVIGKDSVWVLDALIPEAAKETLAEIRKHTSAPVRYVVNSHHHSELVGGNAIFPQAEVLSHVNARKNLMAEQARAAAKPQQDAKPPARLPTLTYTDRLVFYDGDREVQLIHLGRYHTNGDTVLFLPREKVLLSGDLLPGIGGPGGQREAYFRDFVQSIDKALALDFDVIVPGRGQQLASKQDLRNFQAYLKKVIDDVLGFVNHGASLELALRLEPPPYLDRGRSDSLPRLWADTIKRLYQELEAEKKPR
jgi:glyoxylase-like metal-dependent hydrolase (beta-lactamase superfamily II)